MVLLESEFSAVFLGKEGGEAVEEGAVELVA
eukprot:CAMPEP_0167802892 /NCGR_PEP_ID=MMETSP0111_2-20121227/19423_1 /TAXON_ID=91324 /ORGANISM="Lotharella globosa, Strain CCCM811" /LENGTH=30 /DNA_ID= /DNA_START= /DNA_END= /DNA_ORIENTATION=